MLMKKTYIIAGVILLVAILAMAGVLFGEELLGGGAPTVTAPPGSDLETEEYKMYLSAQAKDIAYPLLKTDIEDIFYTINAEGAVQFYKYADSSLTEIDGSGSYEVEAECSSQKIPATVHYYEEGGKISGYGLFTTAISDASVRIYEYAFFKLANFPENYVKSGSYLLLVDTKPEDFYINDKIYEEPFYFTPPSGSERKKLNDSNRLLNDENRLPDLRGAKRPDHSMVTAEALEDCKGELLFFSSRDYHLSGAEHKVDIYESGRKGYNQDDNYRFIMDAADYYAKNTEDGGVLCLKNTEDGFSLLLTKGRKRESEKETLREFSGSFKEDYIRSGDYLLQKSTNTVYNLIANTEIKLNLGGVDDFKADIFAVCPETGSVFMRGFSKQCPAIVLGSVDNALGKVLYNPMFSRVVNPLPASDGTFLVSISNDDIGSSYKVYMFK